MPDQLGLATERGQGMDHVVLTVDAREHDHGSSHVSTSTTKSSNTGFARS